MRIRWNSIGSLSAALALVVFVQVLAATQAPAGQRGAGADPAQGQGGRGAGGGAGRGRGGAAQPAVPAGPTPRLPNGKPDLTGHWTNPYTSDMARGMSVVDPVTRQPLTFERKGQALQASGGRNITFDLPYTAWGEKHWREYDPVAKGDYAGSCMPFGMSRNINSPHGLQFVQNNDFLAILFEQNTWFHMVPTNANFKWPADLPPTWNGTSTGRWDGDTLIVETTGFNGWTKLDTSGHPHSKELKMINTFLRTDSNTIQHTVTIHDPKAFTKDWMNVRNWTLKRDADVLMEYSCEENNLGVFDGAIKRWEPPTDED